jgi:hypothetical protein
MPALSSWAGILQIGEAREDKSASAAASRAIAVV